MRRVTVLAIVGGLVYGGIEIVWRGYTHWTMMVLGGILFVIIGGINEVFPWEMPITHQVIIGALVVTGAELIAGCILNLWLGLDIWDYSGMPFNLWGQISLAFSLAWVGLSAVAIFLDDWLRHRLFGEECPHYHLL